MNDFLSSACVTRRISTAGWTPWEVEVMADHKWWSVDELMAAEATVWPADLHALLRGQA